MSGLSNWFASSGAAGWAVEALIASTLLMALVLLVRAPVRRAFGPQVAYALWLLPLLRMALPPLPAVWRAAATPINRAGETIAVLITSPGLPTGGAASSPDVARSYSALLAILWACGAVGFLGYHLVAHARFCRGIFAAAQPIEEQDGIRIIASAAAPAPLAFGIWQRYVAFPLDVAERYDADERALALAHEIGHHQRGDLIANWVGLAVLALHWFNPLAWRAFRAFRADQELANDARVLASRSVVDRHVYACAIVKAAHGGAVSAACHLHTITDLKGRLKMLSLSPASRRRLASGTAVIGVLVVAGLGLTASGSSAAVISTGVKDAVAQIAPPAPPAASEPARSSAPSLPMGTGTTSTSITTSDAGPHAVKRVVIAKDGKTTTYEGADVDAHLAAGDKVSILPLDQQGSRMIVKDPNDPEGRIEVQDIPAVHSAQCGIGTGKPTSMVINTGKGEKRLVVICTDRIRRVTADAMVTADSRRGIERDAYSQALAGLIDARTRIAANADMREADRTRALTAIDQSITEMKGQLARFD